MIGPSFGGSGENSSFSSPGTSRDLGCSNDGSREDGAGDHKNTREKRKSDSVNKDDNGTGFPTIILMTGNLKAYFTIIFSCF